MTNGSYKHLYYIFGPVDLLCDARWPTPPFMITIYNSISFFYLLFIGTSKLAWGMEPLVSVPDDCSVKKLVLVW